MSWGRGTQETGTHEGPLAVVQAGSDRDLNWNSGEEEATDGEERSGGVGIINRIWQLILHVCM